MIWEWLADKIFPKWTARHKLEQKVNNQIYGTQLLLDHGIYVKRNGWYVYAPEWLAWNDRMIDARLVAMQRETREDPEWTKKHPPYSPKFRAWMAKQDEDFARRHSPPFRRPKTKQEAEAMVAAIEYCNKILPRRTSS